MEDIQAAPLGPLSEFVQESQYVGEVFSMGYDEVTVQVHDAERQEVGGIPNLSFLVATRLTPSNLSSYSYRDEDASVILLRVVGRADLPNSEEAERLRMSAAREAAGRREDHWDHESVMDIDTNNYLSFAGLRCKTVGTFYLDGSGPEDLALAFGSDISNFYPNRGLKVYKPAGKALSKVVNYRTTRYDKEGQNLKRVEVGNVRYASTDRRFQGVGEVRTSITPKDLLSKRSAVFGMTRTGKSNTTKVIAKSVYELRFASENPREVGQIIFDPNGEYANQNAQDDNTALRNVYRASEEGEKEDVKTYGLEPRKQVDPDRKLMKLNFFQENNLLVGKQMIDSFLEGDDAKYIRAFKNVSLEKPKGGDRGLQTRRERCVLAYRALLSKALDSEPHMRPKTKGLFGKPLIEAMKSSGEPEAARYESAARTFENTSPKWAALPEAFEALHSFMKTDAYRDFNREYVSSISSAGRMWAGENLRGILGMFAHRHGTLQVGQLGPQHTTSTTKDYADEIYDELQEGALVIVDQSTGNPELNRSSARRIMRRIFHGHKRLFGSGASEDKIPRIMVFAEEAHNLLPADDEKDLSDVWVRTAKEGAKFYLGLVYITQEVSSIQKNILKATENWFISHLNNRDETAALRKFYDFADFEESIVRAQEQGFLRVKTLSNPYVVPMQIDKFEMPKGAAGEPEKRVGKRPLDLSGIDKEAWNGHAGNGESGGGASGRRKGDRQNEKKAPEDAPGTAPFESEESQEEGFTW